jgi:hypothetical protein
MLKLFIEDLKKQLPLKIEVANWDETLLHIRGENWSFNGLTEWRIVDSKRMIIGCYDGGSEDMISRIIGKEIVDVDTCGSAFIKIDPVFVFSDGSALELFSTGALEPWKMTLPNGRIYIASPTDKNWGCSPAGASL